MKCKDLQYDYVDYIKGMLSEEEKSRIDEHLSNCPRCRVEIEKMKNVSVVLDNYKVTEPGENFFINFIPALNLKISTRKENRIFKKAANFALSFSTVLSVIILMVILVKTGNHNFTSDTTATVSALNTGSETPRIEEIEPSIINYENYVHENLVSKIANETKIEQKATESLAAAAINAQNSMLFSSDNLAAYVDDMSDEEVDEVIEKLKTKNILQ